MVVIAHDEFYNIVADNIAVERNGSIVCTVCADFCNISLFCILEFIGCDVSPCLNAKRLFIFSIVGYFNWFFPAVVFEACLIVFVRGRDTFAVGVGIADLDECVLIVIGRKRI